MAVFASILRLLALAFAFSQRIVVTLVAAFLFLDCSLPAQVIGPADPNVENGLHPFGSYAGSQIDTVGLTSGNLSLKIPLFSLPQRGKLKATVTIGLYRSKFVVGSSCTTQTGTCTARWYSASDYAGPFLFIDDGNVSVFQVGYPVFPNSGGGGDGPGDPGDGCDQGATSGNCGDVITGPGHAFARLLAQSQSPPYGGTTVPEAFEMDGSSHPMVYNSTGGVTTDGSNIFCTVCSAPTYTGASDALDAHSREGVLYSATGQIVDPNGNTIVRSSDLLIGIANTSVDSLGRFNAFGTYSTSGDGSGLSGCDSLATQVTFYSLPGPNGGVRLIKTCAAMIAYQTNFQAQYQDQYYNWDQVAESSGSLSDITRILLFDGNAWTTSPAWSFGYDTVADVSSITLPTGASMAYTWAPYGLTCSSQTSTPVSMWVQSRTVTIPGSPSTSDAYYFGGYSGDSGNVVGEFHNPLGANYDTQQPCNFYETAKREYSNGILARETDTSYQSVSTTTIIKGGFWPLATNVFPKAVTTVVDGIPQNRVEMDYDSSVGGGYSYGKVVQKREYDLVNGSSSTPTRCTEMTYAAFTGANSATYLSENLIDLPRATAIYSGACPDGDNVQVPSGTPIEETLYGYDELALQPSGLTRGTADTLPGNLTSVTRVVNSPSGSPVTTYQSYWDTGTPYQTTDPAGNVTSVFYDPSYAGAYPTQETRPSANGVAHSTSAQYDFNTGLVTSFKDENNQTSVYTYDALDRIWTAHYPDIGSSPSALSKVVCYPDFRTIAEYTATSVALASPRTSQVCPAASAAITKTKYYDGLGRILTASLIESAASSLTTQTTWNAMGLVNSVSNLYRSTSDPTYDVVTYLYDGIGRKLSATRASDSTQQTFSSKGGVSTFTDEVNHSWTRSNDGLGRLMSVLEPGSLATTYGYDALGNLKTITQGGNGSETPRSRSFSYDSLSRLTSSTNPETGTILYSYISPTGSLCAGDVSLPCSKTDARGSATSYNYDALNRLISKSASDGSFTYNYTYDDITKSNGIGRLTHSSNNVNGATDYYYDPMGRVSSKRVCVPSNCQYVFGADASYDLAGNLTDSHLASGVDISSTFDNAGRLSGSNYLPPGGGGVPLLSSLLYSPAGLQSGTLGNGLREEYAYDTRLRVTSYVVQPGTNTASGASVPYVAFDSVGNANNLALRSVPQGGLITALGWAADPQDAAPVSQVGILIDGQAVGQAALGGVRPDVANFFNRPDFTNSGWSATVPTGNLSVGPHNVSVIAYDAESKESTSSPMQINITSDSTPTIVLDAAVGVATGNSSIPQGGLVSASGWAADYEDGAPTARVQVLLDGSPIGDAVQGGSRPDVANSFQIPAWQNSGWTFTGSIHNASVGNHTLSAVAFDKSGNQTFSGTIPITVTPSSAAISGYLGAPSDASAAVRIPVGGTLFTVGWAAENTYNPGASLSRVDLEVDGVTIGQASLGLSRQDVVDVTGRQDFLTSGFTFSGQLTNVAPGEHVVKARAYTHDGSSYLVSQDLAIVVVGNISANANAGLPAHYSYNLGYTPNGNISASNDSVTGDWAYGYDALNRLTQAQSTASGLAWSYDFFGNRLTQTSLAPGLPESTATYSAGNNRVDQFCYDAAGNLLDQVPCSQVTVHQNAYDGEGKLVSTAFGSVNYVYDAEGFRIAKQSFGQTTNVYFYDVQGHMAVETDGNNNVLRQELFSGDRHIASIQNGHLFYAHTNWLGTEAARSDANGNLCETLTTLPFGDGLQVQGTCDPSFKLFTGKERDTESGLDYFGARYYASSMGRWMSPDWADKPEAVPYSSLTNPQSLNLYAYVLNNPLGTADPDGHWPDWSSVGSALRSYAVGVAKSVYNGVTGGAVLAGKIASPLGEVSGVQDITGQSTATFAQPDGVAENVGYYMNAAGSMAAGVVGEGGVIAVGAEAEAGMSDAALASRATEIHGALDPIAQNMRTTAAASVTDANGNTSVMVGSSQNTLSPAQRAMLGPGETAATGPGHAEVTVINAAQAQGMQVNAVAASRTICANCQQAIQAAGARAVNPPQ